MSINISKIFDNLDLISKEKKISIDRVVEILKYSLEKAYLKDNPDVNILTTIDIDKKIVCLTELREVVDKNEDEIDDDKEINLSEAIKFKKDIKIGDTFETSISLDDFERRNAIHVLQIFQQRLNEENNLKIYDLWKDKINSIVRAEIEKNEKGYIEVNLGSTMGVISRQDQIVGENLIPGNKYIFLIKEVKEQSKGWPILLSRTSNKLLEILLIMNIPEIQSGLIEIKSIARVPGQKAKVAVISKDPNIDPIGTCVGPNGDRIKSVSSLINNEKIDIFLYDNDPKQLIVNMCYRERIVGLEITDDPTDDNPNGKIITIICKDEDLSKLIGRNGINVKLMSMLSKYSIDVQPLSIAIEDKIEYEDITHLLPTKEIGTSYSSIAKKPFKSQQTNNNVKWSNKKSYNNNSGGFSDDYDKFSFENLYNSDWDFDVTDEEVENLLSKDTKIGKKKRKDDFDDDVIFVSKSKPTEETFEPKNDVEITKSEPEKLVKKQIEEENEPTNTTKDLMNEISQIKPTKPKVSIDEFFDNLEEENQKNNKNKKNTKKSKSSSKKFNEPKKDKKKVDILDEFDISEDDYDDSTNIEIDDIDYEDF